MIITSITAIHFGSEKRRYSMQRDEACTINIFSNKPVKNYKNRLGNLQYILLYNIQNTAHCSHTECSLFCVPSLYCYQCEYRTQYNEQPASVLTHLITSPKENT